MNIQTISQKINAYERLMRLDKPIGILLLLWPTLWALLIAGNSKPDWIIVLIFVTGTVLMRSAGCVLNDLADHSFDGQVERTKHRPLVINEVSKTEAHWLAATLCLMAFILVCLLNQKTIFLSFVAMFLAATYPFTKRFLALPQAYLGIAFGMGIPMAFAAITDNIPIIAWVLFVANIFWAIAYDTEYAMVDREDDLKIGIKSSAITFGKFDVVAVMVCYIVTLGLLAWTGKMLQLSMAYYFGLIVATLIAVYHLSIIKNREKAQCFKAFLHNNWFGFAVFLGLLAHYYMQYQQ